MTEETLKEGNLILVRPTGWPYPASGLLHASMLCERANARFPHLVNARDVAAMRTDARGNLRSTTDISSIHCLDPGSHHLARNRFFPKSLFHQSRTPTKLSWLLSQDPRQWTFNSAMPGVLLAQPDRVHSAA